MSEVYLCNACRLYKWLQRYGNAGVPHHLRLSQAECSMRLAIAEGRDPCAGDGTANEEAALVAAVRAVSGDTSPTRRLALEMFEL